MEYIERNNGIYTRNIRLGSIGSATVQNVLYALMMMPYRIMGINEITKKKYAADLRWYEKIEKGI